MWLVFTLISIAFWAWALVLDSLLVKHYEKHPVVLMWSQSFFSLLFLCLWAFFLDFSTALAFPLLSVGFIAYLGDLTLFRALDRTDVSVVNLIWAILAIFLVVGGFLLFGESWSIPQAVGAILIFGGIVFLSCVHEHVSLSTVALLTIIAVCYLPYYLLQKAALLSGAGILPIAFWMLLGRESLSFLGPWMFKPLRSRLRSLSQRVGAMYFLVSAVVIVCFFLGVYFNVRAYDLGHMSLIAVVGNTQPFIVMFFAWMLWRLFPRYASRELLTRKSVRVKVISFLVVFVGLGLLVW